MNSLSLKDKILQELMDELDSHEGMKLKPKAAVGVLEVKHGEPDEDDKDLSKGSPMMDGDEDPEDLKKLLHHYMS